MTQIGSVYAQALYSLAREEGLDAQILGELKVLDQGFAQAPEFLRLLASPNLSKEERCGIVDNSFRGKVHPYVLNFLKILTEKGYTRYFSDCRKAYQSLYNADHGILVVTAVTAVPLNKEQSAKLLAKLSRITGKVIELENRVDPTCLGGVRLDYDGIRVDDTVTHRLESIGSLLRETVL